MSTGAGSNSLFLWILLDATLPLDQSHQPRGVPKGTKELAMARLLHIGTLSSSVSWEGMSTKEKVEHQGELARKDAAVLAQHVMK